MTDTTIQFRDPSDLKPLPEVKAMPRWDKESPEFMGFCDDIRDNGIKHPLLVTARNEVADGWTRNLAAKTLQLSRVPVLVVGEEEVREIIIRELVRRRHLTKGQMAYIVAPRLEAAFDESRRRLLNGKREASAMSRVKSVQEWAALMGFSPELLRQARELRQIFEEHEDLRAEYEPKILSMDKPIGLGAAMAGIGFVLNAQKKTGGKPHATKEQLELFNQAFDQTVTRWEYWTKFSDYEREEHFKEIRKTAASLPEDQRRSLAEYYSKVAAEFRKGAK